MPRSYIPKTISFDPSLAARAEKRAEDLGLSFSAYVAQVVRNDVLRGGDFHISPASVSPVSYRGEAIAETPPDYGARSKKTASKPKTAKKRPKRPKNAEDS